MTRYVMTTARLKDAAQGYEDLRWSLICNFFHAGVVALLFAHSSRSSNFLIEGRVLRS